jgi:hypothetical protein
MTANDILRRVGWALIGVGLVDIGVMVYCVLNRINYSSSLNIFAVVAGIFLVRQSLKAAQYVSFFAAFLLSGLGLGAMLLPWLQPFDLLAMQFRLHPIGAFAWIAVSVGVLAFVYWVYRNLTSPAVMEARRAAGIHTKVPVGAFVLGCVLAVGMFGLLFAINHSDMAEKAVSMAREKTGPGYRYHVTSMQWAGESGRAVVTAYNPWLIKDVEVEW